VLGHTVGFAFQRIIHDAYFELRLEPGEPPNVSARLRQGDVADVPGESRHSGFFERSLLLPRLWLNLRLDRRRGFVVCGWLFAE
jgi:hypothetical protein